MKTEKKVRTPTMPLSDIKIRNLKPKEKPYKVSDFEGLFVLVKVSGAKSWRFKYSIDGKVISAHQTWLGRSIAIFLSK